MSASEFDWPPEMPEGFFSHDGILGPNLRSPTGHLLLSEDEGNPSCSQWVLKGGGVNLGPFRMGTRLQLIYTTLRGHVLAERGGRAGDPKPIERPWRLNSELRPAWYADNSEGFEVWGGNGTTAMDLDHLANQADQANVALANHASDLAILESRIKALEDPQ